MPQEAPKPRPTGRNQRPRISPRIRALFGLVLGAFVLYAGLKRLPFIEEMELLGVDGRRWLKAVLGVALAVGVLPVYRRLPSGDGHARSSSVPFSDPPSDP